MTMVTPAVMPNRPIVSAYAHTSGPRAGFGCGSSGAGMSTGDASAGHAPGGAGSADPAAALLMWPERVGGATYPP